MSYLLDTNILIRLTQKQDPAHAVADRAVEALHLRGEILHITPQNLVEFWGVATRPAPQNGLGLTPVEASTIVAVFEASFPLLPDVGAIYPAWKALVEGLAVVGKQVHDARLVAACHAHGVAHLLTFNTAHFARLAGFGPGLAVVHPGQV